MARTWFITGVNSGFGREMTERLLRAGDRVAGTVRRAGSVDDLKSSHSDRFWVASLDLADTAAIKPVVEKAFAELGRIDVVVNNAGYALFGAAEGLSDAQIRHQLDTNLLGPIEVTRAALPHLRAQGGGRILAMSSYGGQTTHAGASLYHASKWGLEGFFDALAQEVASFGIGITIVEPGGARTGFRSAASTCMGTDLDAYKATSVAAIRGLLNDPSRLPIGDPGKMVKAMIASIDQAPAPKRLVLGGDAYGAIHRALGERLADVEEQKDLAFSTGVDVRC